MRIATAVESVLNPLINLHTSNFTCLAVVIHWLSLSKRKTGYRFRGGRSGLLRNVIYLWNIYEHTKFHADVLKFVCAILSSEVQTAACYFDGRDLNQAYIDGAVFMTLKLRSCGNRDYHDDSVLLAVCRCSV